MAVQDQKRSVAAGALTLLLGLAVSLPASAASSVHTPEGDVLTVWQSPLGLGYAVLGHSGTRTGQVPLTGESTRDADPWLELDAASGIPIMVWSRSDGVSLKVAYARFEAGTWTDVHFLTFGGGNHTLPLLGSSRDGSFLFYVSDGSRYMYAPLDLSAGRLFAAPRPIDLRGTKARTGLRQGPAEWLVPDGGMDIPVILRMCDPTRPDCGNPPRSGRGLVPTPVTGPSTDGITDVPIVVSTQQALWSVAAQPECSGEAVVLPDRGFNALLVLAFDGGETRLIARIPIPPKAPATFGANVAAKALASICR